MFLLTLYDPQANREHPQPIKTPTDHCYPIRRTPAGMVLLASGTVAAYLFATRSTVAKEAGGMKNLQSIKGEFTETSPVAANSPGGPGGSNAK